MNEIYFWVSVFAVGLILLKALPAEKLKATNMKIREKLPGGLVAILYVLIGVCFIGGSFLLCSVLGASTEVKGIVTGAFLGAFIGLIPIVDSRHSK